MFVRCCRPSTLSAATLTLTALPRAALSTKSPLNASPWLLHCRDRRCRRGWRAQWCLFVTSSRGRGACCWGFAYQRVRPRFFLGFAVVAPSCHLQPGADTDFSLAPSTAVGGGSAVVHSTTGVQHSFSGACGSATYDGGMDRRRRRTGHVPVRATTSLCVPPLALIKPPTAAPPD